MAKPEPYWCADLKVPRVWSASSIATMSACARKFYYRYVRGFTAKEESLDLLFGKGFHAAAKVYWSERLAHDAKPADALDAAIIAGARFTLPRPIRPKQTGKTPLGIIRCLVWYLDHYDDDPATFLWVGDKPALELPFRYALPLKSPDGDNYTIRGYIDSLRNFGGIHTVWDYKTTGPSVTPWYMSKFEIDFQNYIYSAAAHVLTHEEFSQFMIDVVGAGAETIALDRQPVSLTHSEISEGLKDVVTVIKRAEVCAEENYYPKNPDACTFCDYAGVCNKAPEVREMFLAGDFKEEPRTDVKEDRA